MSKKNYVGAASHSHEDNPLVVEARMQTKALGTLSVYRRAAYSGIAIGAWLIYLSVYGSLSTSSMATAVLVGGIVSSRHICSYSWNFACRYLKRKKERREDHQSN